MPIIDLSFVLVGTTFPLDHGYCLFSALCRVVPGMHGDRRGTRGQTDSFTAQKLDRTRQPCGPTALDLLALAIVHNFCY